MERVMKFGIAAVLLALVCAAPAVAQKMGYIDSEKIQANYKEWATAQTQFNTEMKAWEDEAAKMDQELKDMIAEYDKQRLILSAEKKAEREAAINAKQEALASFTKEISAPGGKAEQRMQALSKPLYEKIQAAIEKVAIENNYDFIFNSAGLAYAKKDLDVTDKVIEKLESGE
jgi:outer membrane protein